MTTIKTHAEIDPHGNLQLNVPIGLPPGKAEVVIVVEREQAGGNSTAKAKARSGLFVGMSPGNIDIDAALSDMDQGWKSKFSGPP